MSVVVLTEHLLTATYLFQDVLAQGDMGPVRRSPSRLQGPQQCQPSCAVSQPHGHRRSQVDTTLRCLWDSSHAFLQKLHACC